MEIEVAEIAKLTLDPGDVLAVKIQSDDITMEHVTDLKDRLQMLFPDNKIMMTVLPTNSTIDFQVIKKEQG